MKKISIILERKNYDSISLLSSEVAKYTTQYTKKLPDIVKRILFITNKYNIQSMGDLEFIRTKTQGDISKWADGVGAKIPDIIALQKLLRSIKDQLKYLPQYQTPEERELLANNKINIGDIVIDLKSDRGRNSVVKQYTPLVYKIVSQFSGVGNLDKSELISAGLLGLTYAMNTYKNPKDTLLKDFKIDDAVAKEVKKIKSQSFKQYAAWCIRYHILDDLNNISRTVTVNAYFQGKLKDSGESVPTNMSIDLNPNGEDMLIDRIGELSDDPDYDLTPAEDRIWDKVFVQLEKKFSTREVSIFYKYFGLNDMKKEKGKDIAKEFSISPTLVTLTVGKIIKFLKEDPKLRNILLDILEIYTESLMIENHYKTKSEIIETFRSDDTFILLEELAKWDVKKIFKDSYLNSINRLDAAEKIIINEIMINNFEFLDKNYKKNKKIIINFLDIMLPADNIFIWSDVKVLLKMNEVMDYYKKYKINI